MAREKGLDLRIVPTQRLGALGPAAAAPRAAEPAVQRHQVHAAGKVLLGVRRRGDRLACRSAIPAPASRSRSARSSSRSSSGWRRRRARCGASGSGCRSSSASARCWTIPSACSRCRAAARSSRSTCRGPTRALAADAGAVVAPSVGALAGLRVLCIDNEPAVLRGMQALLEGWGCSVVIAQGAAEAVRRLQRAMRQARHHPGRLPPRRRHRARGGGGVARHGPLAGAGDHHHRRSFARRCSARCACAAYALLRKPLKAAALRALMLPAHLAARRGGGEASLGSRRLPAFLRDPESDRPALNSAAASRWGRRSW